MTITPKIEFSITLGSGIAEICKPLKEHFGVTFFDFARNYYDGSHIYLSTTPEVTTYLFEKKYHQQALSFKHPDKYEFEYALWDGLDDRYSGYQLSLDIKELFDIAHGFTIVEKHKEYVDVFSFASTFANENINGTYFSYLQNFKHFIMYFRDKTELLISSAEKQKFYSPYSTSILGISDDMLIQRKNQKLTSFFNQTQIKKLHLNGEFAGVFLTNREVECVKPLIAGCSYKQIARLLNISPRTVESRLEQLRNKLGCYKKKDLIDTLTHKDIQNSLNTVFPLNGC